MSICCGIDLGTTYSAISWYDSFNRRVETIDLEHADGLPIIPSVVYFEPGGNVVVGEAARDAALQYPERVIFGIKRSMGNDYKTPPIDGKEYTPQEISSEILKTLKSDAEMYLGEPVTNVMISVPAYFGDRERLATEEAGKLAGLKVLELIPEPHAAVLAFAADRIKDVENSSIIVYDLGGSTFDVTLIKTEREELGSDVASLRITTMAKDGNRHLGGLDWDRALARLVADKAMAQYGIEDPCLDVGTETTLLKNCEVAKRQLSQGALMFILADLQGHQIEISRTEFECETSDLVLQTEMLLIKVLEEAEQSYGLLTEKRILELVAQGQARADLEKKKVRLLLCGSATRMPMIRECVEHVMGEPALRHRNPELLVSIGAAYRAFLIGAGAAAGLTVQTRGGAITPPPAGDISVSKEKFERTKREIEKDLLPNLYTIRPMMDDGTYERQLQIIAQMSEKALADKNELAWSNANSMLDELRDRVVSAIEQERHRLQLVADGQRVVLMLHAAVLGQDYMHLLDSFKLRRFTDVRFPEQCSIHQPSHLSVQITLKPVDTEVNVPVGEPRSLPPLEIPLEPTPQEVEKQRVDLLVSISAESFEADKWWQALSVPFEQDSEKIEFELVGQELGAHIIEVEFFHGSARVGYVVVETQVVEQVIKGETIGRGVQVIYETMDSQALFGTQDQPALTLIVNWREGKDIDYKIVGKDARQVISVGSTSMKSGENTVVRFWEELTTLLGELVRLANLPENELKSVWLNIEGLGQTLCEQLLPAKLQSLSSTWPVGSIVIIDTNERWIPWELIHDGHEFWGDKFTLARVPRVPDQSRFSALDRTVERHSSVQLHKIVNVIGGDLHPQQIVEHIKSLFASLRIGISVEVIERATLADVFDSIADADLVHLTCHGYAAPQPCLQLADDRSLIRCLTPSNVKSLPNIPDCVIFANACTSTAVTSFLGELRNFGWEFYKKGAAAYIGTLGLVPTEYAVAFAENFYEKLLGGSTVGEALYYAKSKAQRENPFWLLYTLYGDPFARKFI